MLKDDIRLLLNQHGLVKIDLPLIDNSRRLKMTITFTGQRLSNVKVKKLHSNSFFLEVDVHEMQDRDVAGFSQRGYIAEIDRPDPDKPIQVLIPLIDPKHKELIETSLDVEDEISFCQNLQKL